MIDRMNPIGRGIAVLCGLLAVQTTPAHAGTTPDGWAGAWAYAISPAVGTPSPTRPAGTYTYRLRLTQSGGAVSLRITNPEEAIPLSIASIRVARARDTDGFAQDDTTAKTLTFGGQPGVTLQAGQSASSDPAQIALWPGDQLMVTLTTAAPSTDVAGNAGFLSLFQPTGAGVTTSRSRPYVTLVSVYNPATPCTIVTLGDSITEGARNQDAARRGWPDRLADRLAARDPDHHCGVVNAGISGNRVLAFGRGAAAVDRFERDVASVPGVTHVVMLEGINDITRNFQDSPTDAARLIAGYRRIIGMAHGHGLKIIGGTLTPGWGYRLTSPAWEAFRAEVNQWIRTSGEFDAVIDFEAATKDQSQPPKIRPEYDSGDHLHPGDTGYQAMADAVPLALFDAGATAPAR